MKIIKSKLSKIDEDIYQIYYKYFYQKSTNRTFKSFVFYTIVIGKIPENPELIKFLDTLNKIKNNFDKQNYIISKIDMFRVITNLNDEYFDTFNVFLLLLGKVEKKEFFFNGINKYKINTNLKFLIDLYKLKDYELKIEEEFSKYNLIEIKEKRKLHWQEPRIIDEDYQISFDIKYIDTKVYKKILELYKLQKMKLSFYPDCLNLKNYVDNSAISLDEKEFGKKYNLDDCRKMNLKENLKFVDYSVENKLYIKLFKNELTFEEVQKNPNNFDDLDLIYTKVVHLIFFLENNTLYIEHIDLEYIFYSLDEFIERFESNNFEKKGERMKRQKIFKIDNAKINLIENLYDLVYNSLDNKDLIDEYFEMLNTK